MTGFRIDAGASDFSKTIMEKVAAAEAAFVERFEKSGGPAGEGDFEFFERKTSFAIGLLDELVELGMEQETAKGLLDGCEAYHVIIGSGVADSFKREHQDLPETVQIGGTPHRLVSIGQRLESIIEGKHPDFLPVVIEDVAPVQRKAGQPAAFSAPPVVRSGTTSENT